MQNHERYVSGYVKRLRAEGWHQLLSIGELAKQSER